MDLPADSQASSIDPAGHWSSAGLTTFVGREADVAAICDVLVDPSVRLLTLVGPGGVGKTRLAGEIAARLTSAFPEGVVFVELASVSDPALFAAAILRALGGEQEPAASDIGTLVSRLQNRYLLLVLDNLEQLLASAPDLQAVLVRCPGITALVTSRTLLNVRGEFEYVLEPLAHDDGDQSPAVQLLRDRARSVLPANRAGTLTPDLAARICAQVDGLPLAIELAAAQLRLLSPGDLLSRLASPASLEVRGPRDLPDRQETMESTVAWSYRLLPPDTQVEFAALSVFTGGFSLESAHALLGNENDAETIATLKALVANSLVRSVQRDGSVRFTMLEMIRVFGLRQLTRAGREREVRNRHALHFVELAERKGPELRSATDHQLQVWLDIEADIANYRSALDVLQSDGRIVDAAALVSGLDWFWTDSNYVAEGLRLIDPLASSPGLRSVPIIRARSLRVQTVLADMLGHYDLLDDLIERAIEATTVAGDSAVLCELFHLATGVLIDQGKLGAARAMARNTVDSASSHGQTWFIGAGELNLALIEVLSGDFKAALEANDRGVAAFRDCGDRDLEQSAIVTSGLAHLLAGEYGQAQEIYQSVLNRQLQRIEEPYFFQQVSRGIASVVARTGRPELAARIFGMSDAEFERTGVTLRKPLQVAFDRFRSDVRAVLGDENFDSAWNAGFALSKLDAVRELNTLAAPPMPVDRKLRPAPFNKLSNREYEVLHYLTQGKTDPEIAAALFLSPRTVSQHVSNILSKLQVSSRTAAAALAARVGND